jgi:hypothetical protein
VLGYVFGGSIEARERGRMAISDHALREGLDVNDVYVEPLLDLAPVSALDDLVALVDDADAVTVLMPYADRVGVDVRIQERAQARLEQAGARVVLVGDSR